MRIIFGGLLFLPFLLKPRDLNSLLLATRAKLLVLFLSNCFLLLSFDHGFIKLRFKILFGIHVFRIGSDAFLNLLVQLGAKFHHLLLERFLGEFRVLGLSGDFDILHKFLGYLVSQILVLAFKPGDPDIQNSELCLVLLTLGQIILQILDVLSQEAVGLFLGLDGDVDVLDVLQ